MDVIKDWVGNYKNYEAGLDGLIQHLPGTTFKREQRNLAQYVQDARDKYEPDNKDGFLKTEDAQADLLYNLTNYRLRQQKGVGQLSGNLFLLGSINRIRAEAANLEAEGVKLGPVVAATEWIAGRFGTTVDPRVRRFYTMVTKEAVGLAFATSGKQLTIGELQIFLNDLFPGRVADYKLINAQLDGLTASARGTINQEMSTALGTLYDNREAFSESAIERVYNRFSNRGYREPPPEAYPDAAAAPLTIGDAIPQLAAKYAGMSEPDIRSEMKGISEETIKAVLELVKNNE